MNRRIKVSPDGAIVVYEPESDNPDGPWFCAYRGTQMFYADDEVKDWPDWAPVTWREYSYFVRDVAPGLHIVHEGNLREVTATQQDGIVHRLELAGRREPLILDSYRTVRVLMGEP